MDEEKKQVLAIAERSLAAGKDSLQRVRFQTKMAWVLAAMLLAVLVGTSMYGPLGFWVWAIGLGCVAWDVSLGIRGRKLSLELEHVLSEFEATIEKELGKGCRDCNGTGRMWERWGWDQTDFDAVDCPTCGGSGSER